MSVEAHDDSLAVIQENRGSMTIPVRLRSASLSHLGARSCQEDASLADDALGLYAVADGMGASMSGRPAADLAITTLQQLHAPRDPGSAGLVAAVTAANAAICERTLPATRYWSDPNRTPRPDSHEFTRWLGLGTTIVALRLGRGAATIAHRYRGDHRPRDRGHGKRHEHGRDHQHDHGHDHQRHADHDRGHHRRARAGVVQRPRPRGPGQAHGGERRGGFEAGGRRVRTCSTDKNLKGDGTIQSRNLEGFFGSAVYYGVGSWACQVLGGTTQHPIYTKFGIPSGWYREQMKTSNLFRNSVYSGGFLPILDEPSKTFQNCLGTIYHRNPAIRDTLNALQSRQRHNLKFSLVSAYVRRIDAAFAGDSALQALLDDMRDLLLQSEARMAINMLDVPEDERHRGKDWRAQLLDSGVPKFPSKLGGKARLSAGDGKPEEPEPDVPPLRVANPVPPAWEDDRPIRKGREALATDPAVMGEVGERPALWNRERAVVAGIGGFGALFAAGWAMSKVYKRKSGPL